jgi:prevent-host-death family protein
MPDGAHEIAETDLGSRLTEVLDELVDAGARTFITRAGKRIAAVVPADEAEMLEAAEDAYLNRLADEALEAQGEKPHKTLAEVVAEYAEDFGEEVA